MLALLVALSLASPGDTLIRTNLGKLIPIRGVVDPPLPLVAPSVTDDFSVDSLASYTQERSTGVDNGTWTVSGGVATMAAPAGWSANAFYGMRRTGFSYADGYVEAVVTSAAFAEIDPYLKARSAGGSTHDSGVRVILGPTGGSLWEWTGAAWTQRAVFTRAQVNGTYYTLRLQVVGTAARVFVDGVEVALGILTTALGEGEWGGGGQVTPSYSAGRLVTFDSFTFQPTLNVHLEQYAEGVVTLTGALPPTATAFRVYLSTTAARRGTLQGTYTSGQTFSLTAGVLRYATVVPVNGTTELFKSQRPLQMYESIVPNYNIRSIFHDRDGVTVWALGHYTGANKATALGAGSTVALLKSTDWFSTFSIVKTWTQGTDIDVRNNVALHVDKYGFIYVCSTPNPLISKDGGATWSALTGITFDYPANAQAVPFWSWSEREDQDLITLSEYGGSTTLGQRAHSIHYSTDPNRTTWSAFRYPQSDQFIHIHDYLINPYSRNVHLISLGDYISGAQGQGDATGLFASTDGGVNGGTIPARLAANNLLPIPSVWVNGPTHLTFWPSGEAFVAADQQPGIWATVGTAGVWTAASYVRRLVPADINSLAGYPYSAAAVRGSYETYSSTALDGVGGNHGVFRYDGDTGRVISILRSSVDSALLNPRFLGATVGGLIPAMSPWVFSSYNGGVRIPRVAAASEPVIP